MPELYGSNVRQTKAADGFIDGIKKAGKVQNLRLCCYRLAYNVNRDFFMGTTMASRVS